MKNDESLRNKTFIIVFYLRVAVWVSAAEDCEREDGRV
jgi:hypothetical protein